MSHASPQAFAAVLAAHERDLYAIALRLCRRRSDAGDLLQDTFERALRGRDRLRLDGNPRSWLITILQNIYVDGWRRQRHRASAPAVVDVEDLASTLADDHAVDDHDAEAPWRLLGREDVERALGELSDTQREVTMLAIAGRSYKEIADTLGIPMGTVGTRISRARQKLRVVLSRRLRD